MPSKRKPEDPLTSEPVPKTRRISISSDSQDDAPPDDTRASSIVPLTKENLRQFTKMTSSAGPKSFASSPSASKVASTTSSGRNSKSTTEIGFSRLLQQNNVLDRLTSEAYPPCNESEMLAYFRRDRATASPTPSRHELYKNRMRENSNEAELECHIRDHVFRKTDDLYGIGYRAKFDKQWVDFPSGVGFNNGCSPPKPDLAEGFIVKSFPDIIHQIGGAARLVDPDKTNDFIALPHFAAEFKDFGKDMRQAEVQACYDGAAMVYARNRALAFIGEKDPPRHASVVTIATDGRDWKVYAHYALADENSGAIKYYQYLLDYGDLTKYGHNKTGRRAIRNIQDWAREQAATLKDRLWKYHDLRNKAPSAGLGGSSSASAGKRSVPAQGNAALPTPPLPPGTPGRSWSADGSNKKAQRDGRAMPPPPSRSSATSSVRSADQRSPPSPANLVQPTSADRLAASRSSTPNSAKASMVSDGRRASGNSPAQSPSRNAQSSQVGPSPTRSGAHDGPARGQAHGSDSYRGYRDRSDGSVPSFQKRRTASPEKDMSARQQPQPQRDDRRDRGSASGSSDASSPKLPSQSAAPKVVKISKGPPVLPKGSGSMFTLGAKSKPTQTPKDTRDGKK